MKKKRKKKREPVTERGVRGVAPGAGIRAERLTEGAAVRETTRDQEAEKEGEAGTGTEYSHTAFLNVKVLRGPDLSAWATSVTC